jgi:hypothetical protein
LPNQPEFLPSLCIGHNAVYWEPFTFSISSLTSASA